MDGLEFAIDWRRSLASKRRVEFPSVLRHDIEDVAGCRIPVAKPPALVLEFFRPCTAQLGQDLRLHQPRDPDALDDKDLDRDVLDLVAQIAVRLVGHKALEQVIPSAFVLVGRFFFFFFFLAKKGRQDIRLKLLLVLCRKHLGRVPCGHLKHLQLAPATLLHIVDREYVLPVDGQDWLLVARQLVVLVHEQGV